MTTWSGCDFVWFFWNKIPDNVPKYWSRVYIHLVNASVNIIEPNIKIQVDIWIQLTSVCYMRALDATHAFTHTLPPPASPPPHIVPHTHTATRPASRFHGWTQTNTSEWVKARWLDAWMTSLARGTYWPVSSLSPICWEGEGRDDTTTKSQAHFSIQNWESKYIVTEKYLF